MMGLVDVNISGAKVVIGAVIFGVLLLLLGAGTNMISDFLPDAFKEKFYEVGNFLENFGKGFLILLGIIIGVIVIIKLFR